MVSATLLQHEVQFRFVFIKFQVHVLFHLVRPTGISPWGLGLMGFVTLVPEKMKPQNEGPTIRHVKCNDDSTPHELRRI